MEGRDIGYRIAQNADIKFCLTADFETRVRRLNLKELKRDMEENIKLLMHGFKSRDFKKQKMQLKLTQ